LKHEFVKTYLSSTDLPTIAIDQRVPFLPGKTRFVDRFEDLIYSAAISLDRSNATSVGSFNDDFSGTSLDLNKWEVRTATTACCGDGVPATYSVSGGYLNIAVPGGSCGYCGVGDGSSFSPKVAPLEGDFEVYVSFQELSRTSRDGTGPMNIVALDLANGATNAGIYVVGDVLNNSGTRGHNICLRKRSHP
jgi:hypothetical protein